MLCVFSIVSNCLQPCGLKLTRLLCPWDFPGKNTGVGCHFLLPGIFPTQGSNPLSSPASAGKFFTTVPPGKPVCAVASFIYICDFIYFIFGCAGSLSLHGFFSRCSEQGFLSSCGAWASHRSGFSCSRAQALGHMSSIVVVPGL